MEGTGRIKEPISEIIRDIVFADAGPEERAAEFARIAHVDQAHLVMLQGRGLADPFRIARVLRAVDALARERFASLLDRPAPRGLYLLYETWLIEQTGADTGGIIHLGRSRNDLNATIFRLRLRTHWTRLVRAALLLQAAMERRASRFAELVMPAYTHYQAAVPVTYGHYLAGVATALTRDVSGLMSAAADLQTCPLGAGAAGGTTIPIDSALTARLLGFDRPAPHSIDAVASRDVALRLLSAAAILSITLSRLAADFLLWSTAEFSFLAFPDRVIGSSSMMPQKRNPFVLEHIQGKAASATGAFLHAAMAMHATPFTNSVAVSTEAIKPVWRALDDVTQSCVLARVMVASAMPNATVMARRAEESHCTATEAANRLAQAGMSFRQAHQVIGSALTSAEEQGLPYTGIEPADVVISASFGGGPGGDSIAACLAEVRNRWLQHVRELRGRERLWAAAREALAREVASVCQSAPVVS